MDQFLKVKFRKRWKKHVKDKDLLSFHTIFDNTALTVTDLDLLDTYRYLWDGDIEDEIESKNHMKDMDILTRVVTHGGVEMIKCSNDFLLVYRVQGRECYLSMVGFYNYCYRLNYEYEAKGMLKMRQLMSSEINLTRRDHGPFHGQLVHIFAGIGDALGIPRLTTVMSTTMGYYDMSAPFSFSSSVKDGYRGFQCFPSSMAYYLFNVTHEKTDDREVDMPMWIHDIKIVNSTVILTEKVQNCVLFRAVEALEPECELICHKSDKVELVEVETVDVRVKEQKCTCGTEYYLNKAMKVSLKLPPAIYTILEEDFRCTSSGRGNLKKGLVYSPTPYSYIKVFLETLEGKNVSDVRIELYATSNIINVTDRLDFSVFIIKIEDVISYLDCSHSVMLDYCISNKVKMRLRINVCDSHGFSSYLYNDFVLLHRTIYSQRFKAAKKLKVQADKKFSMKNIEWSRDLNLSWLLKNNSYYSAQKFDSSGLFIMNFSELRKYWYYKQQERELLINANGEGIPTEDTLYSKDPALIKKEYKKMLENCLVSTAAYFS